MSEIDPHETVSRFVFSSSHIGTNPPRIKPAAYLPTPKLESSVFRTSEMEESEIWTIGREIAEVRQQTLHGRGDLEAEQIPSSGLTLIPAEPPPKHANIIGWSASDKSAQKSAAQFLASKASTFLAPATPDDVASQDDSTEIKG